MATYKIISHAGTGRCLNIYGNGQITNHRNVCLWSDSGANEQKWNISSLTTTTKILSYANTAFGLNVWRGSDNMNNCDVYPVSGNEKDCAVIISVVDTTKKTYRIKLANYPLYLTAIANQNNGDVRWQAENNSSNQQWKLETINTPTPPTSYTYPTDSSVRRITTPYSSSHPALDIAGASGSNLYAFADGVIAYTQNSSGSWSPNGPDLFPPTSMQTMGNMITINHINPDKTKNSSTYVRTVYMHMRDNPTLKVGTTVKKGQPIGYIGNTGRSSGPHLHFTLAAGNYAYMKPGATEWKKQSDMPTINPRIYLPDYN